MRWVDQQIDSIFAQLGVSVTLFVSVDCSQDGTELHLNHLEKLNPAIVVLPCGERFGGAAKNFFRLIRDVDFSDFDYISLADQDDIWNDNKLINAISVIEQNSVDAYSSNVTAFWENGRQSLINKAQTQQKYDFLFEAAGPGCTYVLTTKLAIDIKACMNLHWAELQSVNLHDWFVYAFARANGYVWFIDPNPSMLYRQHSSNQVGVNSGWKAFHYRFNKLANGWGLEQALKIAKIIGIKKSAFVQSWSSLTFFSIIKLSFKAYDCRRRIVDKIVFMILCWVIAFRRDKKCNH